MKVISLICSSALLFNCGVENQANGQIIDQESNRILDQIFETAPSLSMEECFYIDSLVVNEDLFIKPIEFENIYQVDSLRNKYDPNSDRGYLIGKSKKNGYRALFINRYYAEWIKSVEMLTYDTEGKLKGFLILALTGGDIGDFYEMQGCFQSDTIYYSTYVSMTASEINDVGESTSFDSCDSTMLTSLIKADGTINLKEKLVNAFECID